MVEVSQSKKKETLYQDGPSIGWEEKMSLD